MPSIRSFSWCRNVFLAYGQEPQNIGGDMQWTRSGQRIAKEKLTQDARGWRVWSWSGPLGLAFILGWGWALIPSVKAEHPPRRHWNWSPWSSPRPWPRHRLAGPQHQ